MAASAPPTGLIRALTQLAEPLVRLLLRHGMTLPMLVELLKDVYIRIAERELGANGKPATDSRISLHTGVHRKDVRRLRGQAPPSSAPSRSLSLGAQLVSRWMGERPWKDARGVPRPLPYRAAGAGGPSFEALAESVSRKDLSARALLDELQRLGIAHRDDDGVVHLDVEGFAPRAGFDEQVYYFGETVHDHIAAAVDNLATTPSPHLERAVFFGKLGAAEAAELEALARKQAEEALRRVNARGVALKRRKRRERPCEQRISLGFYVYRTHDMDDGEGGDGGAEQ